MFIIINIIRYTLMASSPDQVNQNMFLNCIKENQWEESKPFNTGVHNLNRKNSLTPALVTLALDILEATKKFHISW